MTIGSQVKSCFSSLKSAEATLEILANKTQDSHTRIAYEDTKTIIEEVKNDLQKQIIYLTQEEPQYKS